jgi:hypothetical protein
VKKNGICLCTLDLQRGPPNLFFGGAHDYKGVKRKKGEKVGDRKRKKGKKGRRWGRER